MCARAPARSPHAHAGRVTLARMRILVVEDEPPLARTIAKALTEAGYAADIARDGEEGLHLGRSYDFDAVVLDLLLPKRHGLSVLKELRRAKPSLPILVL